MTDHVERRQTAEANGTRRLQEQQRRIEQIRKLVQDETLTRTAIAIRMGVQPGRLPALALKAGVKLPPTGGRMDW